MSRSDPPVPDPPGERAGISRSGAPAWYVLAILVIIAGLWASVRHLWVPYSYWVDELFSVNASSGSLARLHEFLRADVHPPLYQVLLMAWMALFGSAEPTTRALSWLFAAAALVLVFRFGRRFGSLFVLVAVAFLVSNRLFAFYSNETRSFALALFLSTAVVTSYPHERRGPVPVRFLLACVLLALTHYFGVLLAVIALAFAFFESLPDAPGRRRIAVAGALCMAWPVYHALNGAVLAWTGGDHWIRVDGIADSLATAAYGYVPRLLGPAAGVLLVGVLAVTVGLALRARGGSRGGEGTLAVVALRTSAMAILYLAGVALIDLATAVSTPRNYIVLLPLVTISVAAAVSLSADMFPGSRHAVIGLALLYTVFALAPSYRDLDRKRHSPEDWKSAFRVAASQSAGRRILVHAYRIGGVGLADHYLRENGVDPGRAAPYAFRDGSENDPAVLVSGGLFPAEHESLMTNLRAIGARRVFPGTEPEEAASTGVFLID